MRPSRIREFRMKKIILCFGLLLAFAFTNNAQSQQKTAYEKRIEQIEKEASQKFKHLLFWYHKGIEDFLGGRNTEQARAYTWYKNELEKAKKIKTSEDFRREEAKRKEEEEDAWRIKESIKNVFESWHQQGEFEKQADYEERLKKESKNAFSRICVEGVKNRIDRSLYIGNNAHSEYADKRWCFFSR